MRRRLTQVYCKPKCRVDYNNAQLIVARNVMQGKAAVIDKIVEEHAGPNEQQQETKRLTRIILERAKAPGLLAADLVPLLSNLIATLEGK